MSMRLSTVALVVPSYEAGLAFFVDGLGFTLIEDTDRGGDARGGRKRWVLVAPTPEAETRLLLAQAVGAAQTAAIGNQTGGRVGFFLTTDDFARDHARFTAAGARFTEAPRHEAYGIVAVFADPFGNRWDLIQPA